MMGKTITYDDSLTVTVTGILKDWNKNSDFDFSDFISFSTINSSFLKNQFQLDNWFNLNHGSQELVKLPTVGINPSQIDAQFPLFIKKHLDPEPDTKLHAQLQPFTGIHFHREYGGEGNKMDLRILYILSAVAIIHIIYRGRQFYQFIYGAIDTKNQRNRHTQGTGQREKGYPVPVFDRNIYTGFAGRGNCRYCCTAFIEFVCGLYPAGRKIPVYGIYYMDIPCRYRNFYHIACRALSRKAVGRI